MTSFDWTSFLLGVPAGLLVTVLLVILVVYLDRRRETEDAESAETYEKQKNEEKQIEALKFAEAVKEEIRKENDYLQYSISSRELTDKVHMRVSVNMYNNLYDFRLYENVRQKVRCKIDEHCDEIVSILDRACDEIHQIILMEDKKAREDNEWKKVL